MSNSCTNDYFVNYILDKSGVVNDSWVLYLMSGAFQTSCEKMLTEAMLPPECIIGAMPFAISLDRLNVCVQSAQDEIRFPGIGNRVNDVKYYVLMTCAGIAAATYGTDIVNNLTRIETTGADLVVKFGEDRGVFGL